MFLNSELKKVKAVAIIIAAIFLLLAFILAYREGFAILFSLREYLWHDADLAVVLLFVCLAMAIVFGFFAFLINVIIKNNVK